MSTRNNMARSVRVLCVILCFTRAQVKGECASGNKMEKTQSKNTAGGDMINHQSSSMRYAPPPPPMRGGGGPGGGGMGGPGGPGGFRGRVRRYNKQLQDLTTVGECYGDSVLCTNQKPSISGLLVRHMNCTQLCVCELYGGGACVENPAVCGAGEAGVHQARGDSGSDTATPGGWICTCHGHLQDAHQHRPQYCTAATEIISTSLH